MIKNIVKNIENNKIIMNDIQYVWNMNERKEIEYSNKIINDRLDKHHLTFESNIYYPLIYQIEDNCPTCGYRTPISRQKYSKEFIEKNVEYKLKELNCNVISGINCYNKDITGLRELFIILDFLEKYELNINVAVSNYDNLKYLKKYPLNSIIFIPQNFQHSSFNENYDEKYDSYEEKVIKYVKETMNLKVTYQLTLNYNETHIDMFNIINKLKKLDIDFLEIKGFDPFLDSPEEYNPQYSKEYILKIIRLLRLYLPDVELKIQYATNNCNYFDDYLKLGVNTISGIYTKRMNSKLENTYVISELLKK